MSPVESGAASIGKSVEIRGEVKGNEDLVVDGRVHGTIALNDSRLTIGPNAHVEANLSARDIVVLGTVEGDIHASGRVELRKGGHLKGDIHAARLSIEEGAVFLGRVDLSQASGSGSTAASAGKPAPQAVSVAGGDSPGGLF